MKKWAAGLLFCGMLNMGCVTTQSSHRGLPPPTWSRSSKPRPTQVAAPAQAIQTPPGPVVADQVTPTTAHQIAESLRRELDQANDDER